MNRLLRLPLALFLGLISLASLAGRAQEATVIFKDKRSWEVEIVGVKDGVLKMVMKNSNTEADTPVGDVAFLRFVIPFDENEVMKNYTFGEYEKAEAVLADKLRPYFFHLAFENNILPYVMILARSQYWLNKFAEANATADRVLRTVPKERPEATEAALIKCLCLHATGRSADTERIMAGLPTIDRDAEVAPIYWYSLARLHLTTNNVVQATENIANIVAFAGKDFDWMPPALYQSAEFHLAAHRFDVATQICQEMKLAAKDTPWQQKALDLLPRIEQEKKAHELRLRREAEALAAKAARSPLRRNPAEAASATESLLKDATEGNR
jgi:hypothetical protein